MTSRIPLFSSRLFLQQFDQNRTDDQGGNLSDIMMMHVRILLVNKKGMCLKELEAGYTMLCK